MNLDDLHDLPPTLNAKQVAEVLGIGLNKTYAGARDGSIPVLKLGRTLRFPTARILDMLGLDADPRAGPPGAEKAPDGQSAFPRIATRSDDETVDDTTTGFLDDEDRR